jgi:hypothetical protein
VCIVVCSGVAIISNVVVGSELLIVLVNDMELVANYCNY